MRQEKKSGAESAQPHEALPFSYNLLLLIGIFYWTSELQASKTRDEDVSGAEIFCFFDSPTPAQRQP
jgi:hypothetical protein